MTAVPAKQSSNPLGRAGTGTLWASIAISALVVIAVSALLYLISGPGSWFVPRRPALGVDVTAGCAASDNGYQDVVNTWRGPPLVPSAPKAGLICQYGPRTGNGQLIRQTRLDQADARQLASVIDKVSLSRPGGVFHCPNEDGMATVIGFAYAHRHDVGLWYAASGCATLDNGNIGAIEGGNPSFYAGFQTAIDSLAPSISVF